MNRTPRFAFALPAFGAGSVRALLLLLLAVCLPWQGLEQAMDRIAAPAHIHVAEPGHGPSHGRANEHGHDQGHEQAQQRAQRPDGVGSPAGTPAVGHHAHALEDDDVVYIIDDHDPHSPGSGSAKTLPLDLALRGQPAALPTPAVTRVAFLPAASAAFRSHPAKPLRRPPRSTGLS